MTKIERANKYCFQEEIKFKLVQIFKFAFCLYASTDWKCLFIES